MTQSPDVRRDEEELPDFILKKDCEPEDGEREYCVTHSSNNSDTCEVKLAYLVAEAVRAAREGCLEAVENAVRGCHECNDGRDAVAAIEAITKTPAGE